MQEGKRQKQIGGLIQEELNKIFQRFGLNMIDGGMVSISSVKITPDLLEARVYLSFFQVADAEEALKKIQEKAGEIKRELGNRVRQQLRRIPEVKYFRDDTLDHVFRMEEIFKKISGEKKPDSERVTVLLKPSNFSNLNLPFLFAWRYFKAKKSTNAINIISWISIGAIIIGTAALILMLGVFNGLEGLVKSLYSSFYSEMNISAAQWKNYNCYK